MNALKLTSTLRNISRIPILSSKYSTTSNNNENLILTSLNDKTGVATVTLNRPPVNSLNLELLTEFSKTLDELTKNNSRGMILTSVRRIFWGFKINFKHLKN